MVPAAGGDGLHGICHSPHVSSRADYGATAHPDEAFMRQVGRKLTMADAETCRVLICDRDAKWSGPVREVLQEAGIRIVQTPYGDRGGHLQSGEPMAKRVRRTSDRINSPRVLGPRHRVRRGPFAPTPLRVRGVLPRKSDASRMRQRHA